MSLRTMVALAVLAALGGSCVLAESAERTAATDLQCEYRTDPLGIDATAPRLSWRIQTDDAAARGVVQSAYQVLVADSLAELENDRGNLWDTGRVASDQSVQVVYQGKPLASGVDCFWKVRIWDQQGKPSAWSQLGKWSMGLLKPSEWQAQWIGVAPQENPSNADPWFRKTFTVAGRPTHAVAYVASLGYHELFLNGKKADDRVLTPSVTDLSQRASYVTYDITACIHEGKNCVGLWCAPGWADFPPFKAKDRPLALAQIELSFADGHTERVVTDGTWKTHASPISPLKRRWQQDYFGGERYDARLEVPGWCDAALDDAAWASTAIFTPQVKLSADTIENRRLETLKPTAIESRGNGVFRVDMGRSYTGWFEIRMKGKPGQKVTFEFSERPDEPKSFRQEDEYIFGDSGEGVFCQRFNYAAARWVTIRGLETPPQEADIRGYLISTDCPVAARFACSNDLLNRIYKTTLWTFRCLSLGGYTVDCPHRERMGYGGDAHATMETAMTNFLAGAFYTKWLQDWRDVQQADGSLPYTAPTYLGGGGPAWSGICVTLPWQVYLHYGDRRVLEVSYPTMQRWLAFLQTKTKNDLLQKWGGEWDFLGDWVPPGKDQELNGRVDDRSTWLFNNCYYIDNLKIAANVADLLGKTADAVAYRQQAEVVAKATQREFFDPKTNTYANGSQLYEAFPLLVGVTPDALRPEVMKSLEKQIAVEKRGHIDTGIHGTYFLLKFLQSQNRNDLVFQMANQTTYPGWGFMLEQGATTLWERWDGFQSRLHSSFVSIGSWFIEGIAGIQLDPAKPGYKHFFIRPGVVGDLTWAKGEYDSPYGRITSDWKLADSWLTLAVEVPANTSATVVCPTSIPSSVTESGRPAAQSPGVHLRATTDGACLYDIGSGRYTFRMRYTP